MSGDETKKLLDKIARRDEVIARQAAEFFRIQLVRGKFVLKNDPTAKPLTPIKYLQPGSGKAQTGYLWTSNIPGGTVFYHWHDGRDAKGMTGLFEKTEATEEGEFIDPKLLPACLH